MEEVKHKRISHLGRRIAQVRKLRGLSQDDLSTGLNISKQAVSKLEQSENIDDVRLQQIADVLGVTVDGLKSFNEENIIYATNNFYETATFTGSTVSAFIETNNQNPIEKITELYESLLKSEREKITILMKRLED